MQSKIQQLCAPDATTAFKSLTRTVQRRQTEIITSQFFSLLQESAREDLLCIHPIRRGKESPDTDPGEAATGGTDLLMEDTAELLPTGSAGTEVLFPQVIAWPLGLLLEKRILQLKAQL